MVDFWIGDIKNKLYIYVASYHKNHDTYITLYSVLYVAF